MYHTPRDNFNEATFSAIYETGINVHKVTKGIINDDELPLVEKLSTEDSVMFYDFLGYFLVILTFWKFILFQLFALLFSFLHSEWIMEKTGMRSGNMDVFLRSFGYFILTLFVSLGCGIIVIAAVYIMNPFLVYRSPNLIFAFVFVVILMAAFTVALYGPEHLKMQETNLSISVVLFWWITSFSSSLLSFIYGTSLLGHYFSIFLIGSCISLWIHKKSAPDNLIMWTLRVVFDMVLPMCLFGKAMIITIDSFRFTVAEGSTSVARKLKHKANFNSLNAHLDGSNGVGDFGDAIHFYCVTAR